MVSAPAPDAGPWVPVAHPQLPRLAEIAPYLEEIDRARLYSNYGPLSLRLESRLADHFGVAAERVVMTANGTLGLGVSLMVVAPPGTLCLMPAWTFVASAHAARLAGLTPYFADVDPASGALTPAIAEQAIATAPGTVGVVMAVTPFGQPTDLEAWDDFADRSGIPVIIDGAAGFDSVRPGRAPVAISLHATKVLGVGEGGVVIGPDAAFTEDMRRRMNFGFFHARSATVTALNAKLSEYHCAVGLAALDRWPETRAAYGAVGLAYREAFAELPGVTLGDGYGDRWVSSTAVLRLDGPYADELARNLHRHNIDTRQWWGRGAHQQPAYRDCPRTPLPVTGALATRTLGLPCYPGLSTDAVARIAMVIRDTLLSHAAPAPEAAAAANGAATRGA